MADIPTIAELQAQIENDLKTELGITNTWRGKVMLKVLATVQAAKLKLFYLLIGKLYKNLCWDTADSEQQGGTLERFGRVLINRNPYPAVSGEYSATITGIAGGTVDKTMTFKSSLGSTSPGKIFGVKTGLVLSGTSGSITIKALEPGTESVLQVGDTLEATAPIANVNSVIAITAITVTPVDAEDLDDYRRLITEQRQLEPQGGAATDYRLWASDVTGVRTVYPYTKDNAIYTVQVFVEALPEDSQPGFPEGVPPASMLTDVAAVIELDPDTTKDISARGRRPLQATVEVNAVVPVGVTVTINDLSDKSSPVTTAITTALEDLLYTIRPYIPGADGATKKDTLYLSAIISAVFGAIDEDVSFSSVAIEIDSVTYTQYRFGDTPVKYGTYPYLENLVTP